MNMEPSFEELVQEQIVAIAEQQAVLDAAKEAADENLVQAAAALEASEKHEARWRDSLNVSNNKQADTNRQIKATLPAAVLKVFESVDGDSIDFAPLGGKLETLEAEYARGLRFLREAPFYHLEAQDLRLNCQRELLLAEAAQIDILCNQRDLQLRLALTPIAATEGQLLVDTANTVTGELRRRAGQLRQEAAGLQEQIDQVRQRLKTLR